MSPIERNTRLAKDVPLHEQALRDYLGRFFKNAADIEDVAQGTYARLLSLNGAARRLTDEPTERRAWRPTCTLPSTL
jgi:DNA-directed RNA polymerase specialized sigma24 family protein